MRPLILKYIPLLKEKNMDKQSAQGIINWLEKNQSVFTMMSDQIWQTPELAFQEFKSSHIQADYLEKEGFSIT